MKKIIFLTIVIFTLFSLNAAFAMRAELQAISSIKISPETITAGSDVTVTITSTTKNIDHIDAIFTIQTSSGASDFAVTLKSTGTNSINYTGVKKLPTYIIGGSWKLSLLTIYYANGFKVTMAYPELKAANKATTFATTSDLYKDLIEQGVIENPDASNTTSNNTPTDTSTTTTPGISTTTTTTNTTTSSGSLSDIKGHWAQGSIQKLIDKKYIKGYPDGYFIPNRPITRAEFIKVLVLALNLKSTASTSAFKDTKTHWAKNEIAAAKEANITDGYNDGTFKPNNYITRAEIVSMLSNAKHFPNKSTTIKFSDVKKGSWAEAAIYAAAANNIVSGYKGGLFKPNSEATRAEACSMIDGFLTNIK